LQLSKDEQALYEITCRGLGAGPNGGADFKAPVQGTYIGDIQLGSFQKIAMPNTSALAAYTKQVISNTFEASTVTDDASNPLPAMPQVKVKCRFIGILYPHFVN